MDENQEYIKNKNVIEIFEVLLGFIYFNRPRNIIEFIIDELKILEKKSNIKKVFNEDDIQSVYDFINLENKQSINREECILGLSQFVLNNKQREYLEKINIEIDINIKEFTSHAQNIINN
ncbi:conserved Plasmodium protein, unknown function [Plasmodium gaboni]|uniref:Uncharacterized protein n=1 Tax=Plasmodium gaboni TaxID=647221 RepID=A0ABY1UUY2_9APIC|nr:conserved Plasmodium protein, unknown function [Plasmodium gaboni]